MPLDSAAQVAYEREPTSRAQAMALEPMTAGKPLSAVAMGLVAA